MPRSTPANYCELSKSERMDAWRQRIGSFSIVETAIGNDSELVIDRCE